MEINLKKFCLKVEKVRRENEKNDFWPIFITSFILILAVSFGPQFIALVKADNQAVSLSATVGPTLSFSVDASSKAFGTVTPGMPNQATSTLTLNTNNNAGAFTTLTRASTTYALFLDSNTIPDTPNGNNWTGPGKTATSTAGPSAVWTDATTEGLGFRLAAASSLTGCGYSTTWWGTDDAGANAKWSGISTSTASTVQSTIANCDYYISGDYTQAVVYKLDVSGSQAAGDYNSSPLTFSVTVN